MANMSYCRFENTLSDLRDCLYALREGDSEKLSKDEAHAKKVLIRLCQTIAEEFGSDEEENFQLVPVNTDGFLTKTFAEFAEEEKDRFGMVLTGAGKPYEQWITGINEMLVKEAIVSETPCFDLAYVLSDNVKGAEGRTDLVIFFAENVAPNTGKLALWRLSFGDCSWADDFVANHASEFKSGK